LRIQFIALSLAADRQKALLKIDKMHLAQPERFCHHYGKMGKFKRKNFQENKIMSFNSVR
jgi:hypothetical protein